MKYKIIYVLIWLAIAGIVAFWTWLLDWMSPGTPFQAFFCSLLVLTPGTILIFFCIKHIKWRYDNGVDIFATLETDPEKVKSHMLFIMQYHGIEENLKELNEIFRNYPQWNLHEWEVFRAWYKHEIDHMTQYPAIYNLTMKEDGSNYNKDDDSLYDPNAPDWSLYDRERYYGDDDDDDFDNYGDNHRRNSDRDALSIGMGIGLVNGLTGGAVFGSGSSSTGN